MHNKIVDKKTATLFYIVVVLIVSFLFHYCQSNIGLTFPVNSVIYQDQEIKKYIEDSLIDG